MNHKSNGEYLSKGLPALVVFARRFAMSLLGFVVVAAIARAENNTSQYYTNGLITDWGATSLYIGNTGSSNSMQISNNSGVTNVTYCYIGNGSLANSNTLVVSDPGSVFNGKTFNDGFWLGNNGGNNAFIVSNSAVSTIGPGYIGWGVGANGNVAIISGTG